MLCTDGHLTCLLIKQSTLHLIRELDLSSPQLMTSGTDTGGERLILLEEEGTGNLTVLQRIYTQHKMGCLFALRGEGRRDQGQTQED